MLSICPHLIPDYFQKVKDILNVYRPQIVEQVECSSVSKDLVARGVYSQDQQQEIDESKSMSNTEKMTKVLSLIQTR